MTGWWNIAALLGIAVALAALVWWFDNRQRRLEER
jgi:hypothetical protein